MTCRWLILADDLTGAADCGIAFARRGMAASVGWHGAPAPAETTVLAVDADSRRLSPEEAGARHAALLRAHHVSGTGLVKKLDSTLRGQPAAEIAALLAVLRAAGRPALAVVAPAFPATGRTTLDGRVRLNGAPLEQSPLWALDHTYADADLRTVLRSAGLSTRLLRLDELRRHAAEGLRDAMAADVDAIVCDAAEAQDLDVLAQAGLPYGDRLLWVGSGGIAAALAGALPEGPASPLGLPLARGGAMIVVGSVAEASRAAAATLEAAGTPVFDLPTALLHEPLEAGAALVASLGAVLASGRDAMVRIAADPDPDLSAGAALAGALATLLAPAARSMGALFATGGETACALLTELGVHGIQLIEEVEPGVPLGITQGRIAVPVMTKAGAFGDAGTIRRSLDRLRDLIRENAA
ncbi:four-carbon acid sugar kinase family protein [Muricoccus radiodurans]|uniref:four-carbon acid sugar kinase family protein n=1 Tax=Muricoccus radiodurans TaxID=2231721 RepID=UPI003CF9A533